jgi:hypothetical protein
LEATLRREVENVKQTVLPEGEENIRDAAGKAWAAWFDWWWDGVAKRQEAVAIA